MDWNKRHAEDPQLIGAIVHNLVAWVLCTPELGYYITVNLLRPKQDNTTIVCTVPVIIFT